MREPAMRPPPEGTRPLAGDTTASLGHCGLQRCDPQPVSAHPDEFGERWLRYDHALNGEGMATAADGGTGTGPAAAIEVHGVDRGGITTDDGGDTRGFDPKDR